MQTITHVIGTAPIRTSSYHDRGAKTEAFLDIQGTKPYRGMIDMKRLILGVAAALMLGAGQAAADGLPSKGAIRGPDGPEVATWSWTGFYLGAGIGYGATEIDFNGQNDGDGILGTVVMGYDRQFAPRWVAGVFADFDFSDISVNVGGLNVDQTYSWSIGARLGTLVTPKTLLYATGGYTQTELEGNLEGTADGYFVGGGLEHMLRDNWTLKLEYRYSEFEADVEQGGVVTGDAELTSHSARLVLSYKFGPRY
jgi:outer membrane immunogenic protein